MIKPRVSPRKLGVPTAAILVAVLAGLYYARDILMPLAFAITLTLVLSPPVAWLQKLHFRRFPAVLLVMVVCVAITGGVGWVIFNELVEVVSDLPRYQENIHLKVEAMHAPGKGALGRAAESVKGISKELSGAPAPAPPPTPAPGPGRRTPQNQPARPLPVQIVAEPANELASLRDLAKPVLASLGIFGIVLILSVFLLIEQTDLRNRLFHLAGLDRLNAMTLALDDAAQRVSRYLMMQMLVNAAFGTLCGIGLYFIGVPYAALWGAIAGIFRIVPYVGAPVAGLLPLLLSLAVFDHWTPPLLVFLLFATLELATGNFVEPWLYGMHTGISSLALLWTTLFWALLWGPAGLILSTPLTVCVVVLGRHVPQLSFLHVLLGDQPVLASEAQVYQRLLAMDDHEARAVADVYLSENSLVQLYDSVVIPALTLAEQDRHKGVLDPTQEEFVFLSMREMIAEFSEKAAPAPAEPEQTAAVADGRVICLPAHDDADEIAAAMLAQLLVQAGRAAVALPIDPSMEEMVAFLEPAQEDVFCISALPPFAFTRAKTLSRMLRGRFPRTRIVIGVWGFPGDTERALQRFQPAPPDHLLTSLASAVKIFVPTAAAADSDPVPELAGPVS